MDGHSDGLFCMARSPRTVTQLLSGAADGEIRLWDLPSQKTLRRLLGHARAVRGLSVAADGRYAVSASDDASVRIWCAHRSPSSLLFPVLARRRAQPPRSFPRSMHCAVGTYAREAAAPVAGATAPHNSAALKLFPSTLSLMISFLPPVSLPRRQLPTAGLGELSASGAAAARTRSYPPCHPLPPQLPPPHPHKPLLSPSASISAPVQATMSAMATYHSKFPLRDVDCHWQKASFITAGATVDIWARLDRRRTALLSHMNFYDCGGFFSVMRVS